MSWSGFDFTIFTSGLNFFPLTKNDGANFLAGVIVFWGRVVPVTMSVVELQTQFCNYKPSWNFKKALNELKKLGFVVEDSEGNLSITQAFIDACKKAQQSKVA